MIDLEELRHNAGQVTSDSIDYVLAVATIAVAEQLGRIKDTLEEILTQMQTP